MRQWFCFSQNGLIDDELGLRIVSFRVMTTESAAATTAKIEAIVLESCRTIEIDVGMCSLNDSACSVRSSDRAESQSFKALRQSMKRGEKTNAGSNLFPIPNVSIGVNVQYHGFIVGPCADEFLRRFVSATASTHTKAANRSFVFSIR